MAKILIGDDPEDVYDFCKVMSSVESFVLSELAEERKRAIARAKANSK